jgi:hypothetical protein
MEKGQLIARGRTSEIFTWGEDCILKLFYDWVPDVWITSEDDFSRQIAATDIPVPVCYGLVEDEGRKGIIFQRLNGDTYLGLLSKNLFGIYDYSQKMAQVHSQILSQSDATLPSIKDRLNTMISTLPNLSAELKAFCLQTLDELPDGNAICHFDFHPDQIMKTEGGDYVIDWSSVCRGDPCADIARTSYLLTMSTVGHMPWFMRILINIMRRTMYRIYVRQMQKLNPTIDFSMVEKWKIPVYAMSLDENVEEKNPMILPFLEKAYSKVHSA